MHDNNIKRLLNDIKSGQIDVDEAYAKLRDLPFTELGFAKIDNHRALRKGFPEVIYCEGKTAEQVKAIASSILERGSALLATRAGRDAYDAVCSICSDAVYHEEARVIAVDRRPQEAPVGFVAVLSAGTADVPVAEEAVITAEMLGARVERVFDVGVAGLHRLLAFHEMLVSAKVIVVVAGMDGALPSVVGGLVCCPVIAVPTSVGYGAHFGGLAPLLTMLNSCATGVAVVNIDNGFGAGYMAALINYIGEDER
ncbi:MAG TPA: nickel pincer cofactor biosynthesis protein LarB [Actinobacteria bacterium]|nr:nickel pincer cofactor biosynthesis protein LarB [Actinomycetota bacterium]